MVSEMDRIKCTGCGACAAGCPVRCIELKPDGEGFVYPVIDREKCTRCGICDEICHARCLVKGGAGRPATFIAYNKDQKDRISSSSGGIFISLARQVILEGGVVYGAALDEDMRVRHIRVETEDCLSELQGSKYVQSHIGTGIYDSVSEDLKSGRRVLYSGAPCQIGALNCFLAGGQDNLVTVSFICRGVPSPLVWEKYLDWQQGRKRSKVRRAFFRNKDSGWSDYSIKLLFENGQTYRRRHTDDPYFQAFLKGVCLRPACHSCQYKGEQILPYCTDILLADKWGEVSGDLPGIGDDKGVSLVFLHSKKGYSLWDRISEQIRFTEVDFKQAVSVNISYRVPAAVSEHRDAFFSELNALSFWRLYKKYARSPFKTRLRRNAYRIAYKTAKKIGVVAAVKRFRNRKAGKPS